MSKPDHISESYATIFKVKILIFFDADPGWKKFGSGTRDKLRNTVCNRTIPMKEPCLGMKELETETGESALP
jgi:hypothetical protein